jgi:hypothetical protein
MRNRVSGSLPSMVKEGNPATKLKISLLSAASFTYAATLSVAS